MDHELLRLLKAYCRIDHDEDDDLLIFLYDAAIDYLGGAGTQISGGAKYRLTVFAMVNEWYDNGLRAELPDGIKNMIKQLEMIEVSSQVNPAF